MGREGCTQAIEEAAWGKIRPQEWQRRACGIGSKGFRVYDWALINTTKIPIAST